MNKTIETDPKDIELDKFIEDRLKDIVFKRVSTQIVTSPPE